MKALKVPVINSYNIKYEHTFYLCTEVFTVCYYTAYFPMLTTGTFKSSVKLF